MNNKLSKILAVAIIAMGVIHDIATFTPLITKGLDVLTIGKQNAITYFSLMCGALLILGGALLLMLQKHRDEHPFLNKPINLIASVMLIDGILAVISMPKNPFAWMVFAIVAGYAAVNWGRGK